MTPSGATGASGRLPGLEALRGVAALCILLLHTRAVFGGTPVFGKGYLAVEFFLMLSGFLMARTQEARLASGAEPWRFLAGRYRRLWPMMALGVPLGVPRLFLVTPAWGEFALAVAFNLALLPVWFGRFAFPVNIPAWTIFYELVANALHVLVLRRLDQRHLAMGAALLAGGMGWIGADAGSFDVGARVDNLVLGLPRILLAYVIGMILGRSWRSGPALRVPPWLALPAMPVLLAGGWALGLDHWTFDMAFTLIACPLMIAGGLGLQRFHRAAGWFGQLSFPLFAVQMPILEGTRMLGWNGWQGGFAALAGGICAALLATALGNWRQRRKDGRIGARFKGGGQA